METVFSKGTRAPSHDHEEAFCCIALSGSCAEMYRNRRREIRPFTVDFLPARQMHSLDFRSFGVRAFSIDISPGWLERARDYSLDLNHSIHSQAGLASALVMRMYREFHGTDCESSLAIEGLCVELLAEISRQQPRAEERRMPKWLELTKEVLHAHFTEPLRLEPIAEAAGVHPVHLAREFRRHFGCTMGDYVRHLRINYASAELTKSDKPLAVIAADAGFADQSHFSRFFKRFTHMTPTEYRRTHTSR
jgi:AraC family transcriptional regulator